MPKPNTATQSQEKTFLAWTRWSPKATFEPGLHKARFFLVKASDDEEAIYKMHNYDQMGYTIKGVKSLSETEETALLDKLRKRGDWDDEWATRNDIGCLGSLNISRRHQVAEMRDGAFLALEKEGIRLGPRAH